MDPDKMITWAAVDEDFSQNTIHGRPYSYRCTFCKRGFSNAQALGGHMNIHRKDRAKLKEFSSESLLSLDITKNTADIEDHGPRDQADISSLETKNGHQCPDDVKGDDHMLYGQDHDDDDRVEENPVQRLMLFAEEPSASGDRGQEKGVAGNQNESSKMKVIDHGELDLELRLGPEPAADPKVKR